MMGVVQVWLDVYEFMDFFVSFVDGMMEQIDVVVFVMGYEYKIYFLDDFLMKIEDNRICLYKYMFLFYLEYLMLGIVGMV